MCDTRLLSVEVGWPCVCCVLECPSTLLSLTFAATGAASRFYEAALKQGTTESLLALMAAEGGAAALSAAGQVDEKTDGLVVINAQVS